MSTPEPLSQAERLDEDNLRLDPLEEGMDPPERWSEADRHGTTRAEEREGQPLGERLAEEEPDVSPTDPPPGPDSPIDRLDDRIDEEDPLNPLPDPDRTDPVLSDAVHRGQVADEAGGSVAEAVREDHPPRD